MNILAVTAFNCTQMFKPATNTIKQRSHGSLKNKGESQTRVVQLSLFNKAK